MKHRPRALTLRRVLAAAVAAGGMWFLYRWVGFTPAAPDLTRADREVSALIATATRASRFAPRDAVKRAELGMAYEANGFDDQALRCYQQALAVEPARPRWWYRLAVVAGRRGDLDGALAAVDRAIALDASYAPAHERQGLWWLEKGDAVKAEASARRALTAAPRDAGAAAGLARVLLVTHRFQEAASLVESALAEHASDSYLYQLLGAAYLGLGRTDRARLTLTAGMRGEPVVRDPWSDELGRFRTGYSASLRGAESLSRTGQLDAAIAVLQTILKTRPDDAVALNYLGASYTERGRTDEAIAALKRALTVNDSFVEAHINLAAAYWRRRANDDGLREADRAIALNPLSGVAYQVKGALLRDAKQLEPAIAAFEQAVRYNPGNVMPQIWTGQILGELKRRREALDVFDAVLKKDPTSADAYAGIAIVRLDAGELVQAEEAIRRGAELNYRNPAIAAARARLWKLQDAQGGRTASRR